MSKPDRFFHATVVDPSRLAAARTHALALGRVFERDALSVVSYGVAARLAVPGGLGDPESVAGAEAALASFEPLGGAENLHPIALLALPFDRDAPGHLVVPAVLLVRRGDGDVVAFAAGTHDEVEAARCGFPFADAAAPATPSPGPPPDRFELGSARPHAEFLDLVAEAIEAIEEGELDKVVVAREVTVVANRVFEQSSLVERLRALHPSCATFALDGFVGASPELLVRREGARVTSQPLAGTVARSGDPDDDRRLAAALLASAKDRAEHDWVVRAIAGALAPLAVELDVPAEPHLLELRNVCHLATTVRARLLEPAPSLLELAAALHPTPAVAGTPRDAALAHLAKHEGLERDRYAGPVGIVDAAGDGELWLGIRSALIDGRRARLLAGVGIVEGSEPVAELAETQLKLQALLAVAVRP